MQAEPLAAFSQIPQNHTLLQSKAPKASIGEDILFVTWIAFGDYGDGGLKSHNFHSVDMRSAYSANHRIMLLSCTTLFNAVTIILGVPSSSLFSLRKGFQYGGDLSSRPLESSQDAML